MDLSTATAAANLSKSVLGMLPTGDKQPHFGPGHAAKEYKDCAAINVFCQIYGHTETEMWRLRMPIDATATDVKSALGMERNHKKNANGTSNNDHSESDKSGAEGAGAVLQEVIQDENGYTLSRDLTKAPLYNLSSGCNLNLGFVYRDSAVRQSLYQVSETTSGVATGVAGAIKGVNDAVQGILGSSDRGGSM